MKKISNIIVLGLCLAAFFTSCVKEENYVREIAELNVNLTPIEENGSVVQGDAITDAMIWAFQCTLNDETGAPSISDEATAIGARYVYDLDTYGSISVHVPLPICNGSQDYLLVAVINTQAYGNFNLTSGSTWGAIKAATFDSTGAFWSTYPNDEGKTPEVMPISNWTTFTVKSNNTHTDNCYQLNLPVYRTVSKAQFLVAKATDDFDLNILDVKVVANSGYSTGALLTANAESATGSNDEAIQRGKPSAAATNWWWASPTAVPTTNTPAEGETVAEGEDATEPAIKYQLKNSNSGFSEVNDITTVVSADDHGDDATYAWIGSTFLFENNNDAPYGETGCYDAAQGNGYNLYVKYQIGEEDPIEVYTPLGKVVRNHDYQVRALVEAGGKLSLNLVVNEWVTPKAEEYNFQSEISVSDNKTLAWTKGSASGITIAGEEVSEVKLAPAEDNAVSNNKPYAVCTFHLATPVDAEWRAALVGGNINAFEFVDAEGNVIAVPSGNVGEAAEIRIRAKQATVSSNMEAYLDIVVVTSDGRTLGTVGALCDGKRQKITQYAN